jgi:hypothetical protein
MQEFLANATQKSSEDLTTAFQRIPEDKRNWSPDTKARTALNQFAECVLLSGYTAELITAHTMGDGVPAERDAFMEYYSREQARVMAQDMEQIQAHFGANISKVTAAIRAVSDDALSTEVALPWKSMRVSEIIAYPSWNMNYHEGQINYIASILGCLD